MCFGAGKKPWDIKVNAVCDCGQSHLFGEDSVLMRDGHRLGWGPIGALLALLGGCGLPRVLADPARFRASQSSPGWRHFLLLSRALLPAGHVSSPLSAGQVEASWPLIPEPPCSATAAQCNVLGVPKPFPPLPPPAP